jgi:FlaA1/EpsC-like NDP-sugar epimerase
MMGKFTAMLSRPWSGALLRPTNGVLNWVLASSRIELIKIAVDVCLIIVAALWAWLVCFGQVRSPGSPIPFLIVVCFARIVLYFGFGLHTTSWLNVSRFEVFWLTVSAVLGPPFIALLFWMLPPPFTLNPLTRPIVVLTTEPAFYLLLLFGARITIRAIAHSSNPEKRIRILIVGAGEAGSALASQIQEYRAPYRIVGFLDDDRRKLKRTYRGVSVLGEIDQLATIAPEQEVQEIVIAIMGLPPARLREIIAMAEQCHIPIRTLPPMREMMDGRPDYRSLREIRMEDLLARPAVKLDKSVLAEYLKGRTVLVTGGGGSIGGELCRQVLAAGAKQLLVLGRGENSIFEITQELAEQETRCQITPVICDIRDRIALEQVFTTYHPEVIFHAAAHKHVPLMEQYPCEAVRNNVIGTLNVVQMAVKYPPQRFVQVSTDKAVEPSSVMGATKRIGEMIVKAYAVKSGLNMVCVRFGNVLGSRGSVVPTMARQIERGLPVTVTDPDMVRYFMTIPEAVQLILQAGLVGGTGEVFVLDMGQPVRILDLAQDLIRLSGLIPNRDIPIHIIGKRPGEKMYEDLLTNNESLSAKKNGPFFFAPSQHVDVDALERVIEELRQVTEDCDSEQAVRIIQKFVPEARFARYAGDAENSSESNGKGGSSNGTNGHQNGHKTADIRNTPADFRPPEKTG